MAAESTVVSTVVSVDDLSVSYNTGTGRAARRVDVLKSVSVSLRPGHVLGLVGESGSGKSTLAGALLGSLRTTSFVSGGSVTVSGQDVFALTARDLRAFRTTEVALVPQNAGNALTPTMKIAEQIAESLHSLRGDRRAQRARAEELLTLVRLPNPRAALDRYPHQFSGGQQQRIGIAVALASEPTVLVLDEPTTGLDVVTQAAILDLLADLQRSRNMSMVIVSHDLGVIDKMCSDVAVLRHGEIVESGRVRQVLGAPAHPYTRGLIASVPRIDRPGIPPSLDHAALDADDAWVQTEAMTVRVAPVDAPVVLAVQGLSVDYRRRPTPGTGPTVEGVSFEVRAGEIVALVGESGSGKSTIATTIAGLQRPAAGTITLAGAATPLAATVARRAKRDRQAVQLIFQNADTSLNPRKTVEAAIQRPIDLFAVPGATVGGALSDVELPGSYAERLPGQLSGGERQRVGIARAISAQPQLVLADEIVSALDVSVQSSILRLVDTLATAKQIGFLFITHDLAVVRSIADRVIVLYLGRIVEEGTVEQIFGHVSHPYTRLLLDAVIELGDDHDDSLETVKDEVPLAPPEAGCPFASRCPIVRDVCHTVTPPDIAVSPTHRIRCHATLPELVHEPAGAVAAR